MFRDIIRPALSLFVVLSAITGMLYPLAVTGLAKVLFPSQAEGSLILDKNGSAIGSRLIGQSFDDPKYFWGRPSATAPFAYNASSSGGSNLAPSNPALIDAVKTRIEALRQADPGSDKPVPVDLVTSSGSGLDPEISPAAAEFQVARVARARALPEAEVRKLVARFTTERTWGVLGEPRVNVLELNLDLDRTAHPQ